MQTSSIFFLMKKSEFCLKMPVRSLMMNLQINFNPLYNSRLNREQLYPRDKEYNLYALLFRAMITLLHLQLKNSGIEKKSVISYSCYTLILPLSLKSSTRIISLMRFAGLLFRTLKKFL